MRYDMLLGVPAQNINLYIILAIVALIGIIVFLYLTTRKK